MKIKDAIENLRRYDPEDFFSIDYCFEEDEFSQYEIHVKAFINRESVKKQLDAATIKDFTYSEPPEKRLEVQKVIDNVVYIG